MHARYNLEYSSSVINSAIAIHLPSPKIMFWFLAPAFSTPRAPTLRIYPNYCDNII